jgi:hypothetical protein
MALIKCEECEHSISDKAQSCPQCGYPSKENVMTRKREKGTSPIGGYLALAVGIYVLFPSIFSFLGRLGFWHHIDFNPLMLYLFRPSILVAIGALFLTFYGIWNIARHRRIH